MEHVERLVVEELAVQNFKKNSKNVGGRLDRAVAQDAQVYRAVPQRAQAVDMSNVSEPRL